MAAASVPVLRTTGGALPNCINHGGCGMSRQILRIIVTVWNISGSGSRQPRDTRTNSQTLPLTQQFPNNVWEFAAADSSFLKHLRFVPTIADPTSTRHNISGSTSEPFSSASRVVAEFAPQFENQKQLARELRSALFPSGTGQSLQQRSATTI
jgi:hypothetical protein